MAYRETKGMKKASASSAYINQARNKRRENMQNQRHQENDVKKERKTSKAQANSSIRSKNNGINRQRDSALSVKRRTIKQQRNAGAAAAKRGEKSIISIKRIRHGEHKAARIGGASGISQWRIGTRGTKNIAQHRHGGGGVISKRRN